MSLRDDDQRLDWKMATLTRREYRHLSRALQKVERGQSVMGRSLPVFVTRKERGHERTLAHRRGWW